jgi:hypothetical protein
MHSCKDEGVAFTVVSFKVTDTKNGLRWRVPVAILWNLRNKEPYRDIVKERSGRKLKFKGQIWEGWKQIQDEYD